MEIKKLILFCFAFELQDPHHPPAYAHAPEKLHLKNFDDSTLFSMQLGGCSEFCPIRISLELPKTLSEFDFKLLVESYR